MSDTEQPSLTFEDRLMLAVLTVAEAVEEFAQKTGYEGCKGLSDEVQAIFDAATAERAPAASPSTAPVAAPAAEDTLAEPWPEHRAMDRATDEADRPGPLAPPRD